MHIMKTLITIHWGKSKETLNITYKTITRPIVEYASIIWSPIISNTNMNKLRTIQNSALRTITGCTLDTNTHHLHTETKILPITHTHETTWITTEMLILATERLKSSVRKARSCAPVPCAQFLFERPVYEGSTRWWRRRFLNSLQMAQSCWAEQMVNCLLKARAIAFGREWVFPSKVIEILGQGFDILQPSLRSIEQ